MTAQPREVINPEEDDKLLSVDDMYKKRKIQEGGGVASGITTANADDGERQDGDSDETVKNDSHLQHVLQTIEADPGGENLATRESTETSHKHDNENSISEEGELVEVQSKTLDRSFGSKDASGRQEAPVTMDNGDDEEDDDNRTDNNAVANSDTKVELAESFFLRDPFTMGEVEKMQHHFLSRMEKSVEVLETEGYKAFQEWRAKAETSATDGKAERERLEQAVKDAKIMGAPREYQQRLFEIACKQNTVIHLGTGAGKTLIALMCIRHFASAFEKGKQTLFLVPSVALAIQQSQVLRSNLPYVVKVACYATSTSVKARRDLQDCNIIVATHGAIHDLLMHYGDMFSIKRFNLIVLDEAHYAIGNHSYAALMKRFYHPLPSEERPRVLGLTASPLVKVKTNHSDERLAMMLQTLESTLDATVVSHMADDPTGCLPLKKVAEKDIVYMSNIDLAPLPSLNTFKIHATRARECQQIFQLYSDLGPLAVSIYCLTLAKEVSRNTFEQEKNVDFQNLVAYLRAISEFCDRESRKCPFGGRSDKLLALEELLENQIEDYGGAETVCLVFVERRITALALNDYFRFRLKQQSKDNWIRASEARKHPRLPGNSTNSFRRSLSQNDSDKSSGRSSPSPSASRASPCSVWDQFADAEDDMEMDVIVPPAEKQENSDVRFQPLTIDPSNQFMDADDDDDQSQDFLQVYRQVQGNSSAGPAVSSEASHLATDALRASTNSSGELEDTNIASKKSVLSLGAHEEAGLDVVERSEAPSFDQFNDADGDEGSDLVSPADHETVRCEALVRNSTAIFKSLNMHKRLDNNSSEDEEARKNWLHQEKAIEDVLSSLRRGEINVLIATSVVEEGVDVQACSCVVAFDSLRSAKGYIQMKGRARQKAAKFYVFKDSDEKTNVLSLPDAQALERRVHQFVSSRPAAVSTTPPLAFGDKDIPVDELSDCEEIRAVELGKYSSKDLHGSVDLHTAKSLVNRYILSLPLDPIVRTSKTALLACMPVYSERQLHLPAHLPSNLRIINLPSQYWNLSKKDKEQVLALIACVRLHKNGVLSDRLLPLNRCDLIETMLSRATKQPRKIKVPSFGPFGVTSTANKRRLFVFPLVQKNERMDRLHKILKSPEGQQLAIISTTNVLGDIIPEAEFLHPGFGHVFCSIGTSFSIDCSEEEFGTIERFFKFLFDSRWRRRTKNVFYRVKDFAGLSPSLPPYYVALMSVGTQTGAKTTSGELDFANMKALIEESERSDSERRNAVSSASNVQGLPKPRLWSPLYDKNFTYISYGPSGLDCSADFPGDRDDDVKTFQDYFNDCRKFEVSKDCLLFDAQRLWVLPFSKASPTSVEACDFVPKIPESGEHSKQHDVCQELRSLMLPKDACMEARMANPSILLMSTCLPQFLHHMQPYLTAHSFVQHCKEHLPYLAKCLSPLPLEKIAEALTATSCSEEGNYDKLEWLGDAVLKLLQTQSLMYSRDFSHWIELLHEGDLSTLRSVMGCNDRLAVVCKNLKIDGFLLTSPLGRSQWSPATLELYTPTEMGEDTGEGEAIYEPAPGKTCADVIESLLGLVFSSASSPHVGYKQACAVAGELEICLSHDKRAPRKVDIEPKPGLLAAARAFTGHQHFTQHALVEEAFTHPTAMRPRVPSYQRLEWVGDAVLCLAVRDWIFKTFASKPVGDCVMISAALESNETLSFLAIKHGLLKNLDHCDQTLPSRIENYQWRTEELKRGLWGTDPPKVAADVVEALIGAVFIDTTCGESDAGFISGMAAATHVMKPMCSVLCKIHDAGDATSTTSGSCVMMHPKKHLQEIGGNLLELKVMREDKFASCKPSDTPVWLGKRWAHAQPDGQQYIATIECLGSSIISVSDPSSEVAGNRASALAVHIFGKDASLLSRLKTARTLVESCASKEAKEIRDNDNKDDEPSDDHSRITLTINQLVQSSKNVNDSIAPNDDSENQGRTESTTQDSGEGTVEMARTGVQRNVVAETAASSNRNHTDEDNDMDKIVSSMVRSVLPQSDW